MRPLAELEAGVARHLVGIFCDIDDTLTTQGRLDPAAYEALCRAAAAGLRVVPVTGRPLGWAEVLAGLWPVAAVIGEGGAAAALPGGGWLWWDEAEARARQRERRERVIARVKEALPWARLASDQELRRVDAAFDIGEHERLPRERVDAICALIEAEGAQALVSSIHAHACFSDYDKARMAVRLGAALWDEAPATVRERYLFVGDSLNDQAGFAFFTWSVGVANVARYLDRLDPPPRLVASQASGRGFAEVIDHLLALRA